MPPTFTVPMFLGAPPDVLTGTSQVTTGGGGTTLATHTGFADSAGAGLAQSNDGNAVNLSTAFYASGRSDLSAVGVRVYVPAGSGAGGAGFFGYLIDSSTNGSTPNRILQTKAFGTVTTDAWTSVTFDTPAAMQDGKTYWAAVFFPSGKYGFQASVFSGGSPVAFTDLANTFMPSTGFSADGNGSYAYGGAGTIPTNDGSGTWYGVDPIVSVSGGTAAVSHGANLVIANVGPWTLQGVPKGSEVLDTPTLPGRGYWVFDTPSEYRPAQTYVYNNNPSNKGGTVPGGGLTIDGYSIPAGTEVAQFRDFSASDFSAQGMSGNYLFRGCRFRCNHVGQSSQFNDNTSTYTNRLFYCDMGSTSAADVDWTASFWKAIGGSNHIMLRNYCSYQYVTFQPNEPGCQFIENYVEKIIYYYGETGPPGEGGPLHMAVIGCEGGGSGFRIMRNKIIPASPDEGGHTFVNGSSFAFEGTNGSHYTDCQVVDNYLSGFNYVILDFGEVAGSTSIVVTGNQITTQWFTNGGVSGVEQTGPNPPVWGSNGNVKSGNIWADDYGTGGNGTGTPLGSRQYPNGNGPRAGTTAF